MNIKDLKKGDILIWHDRPYLVLDIGSGGRVATLLSYNGLVGRYLNDDIKQMKINKDEESIDTLMDQAWLLKETLIELRTLLNGGVSIDD